jgi:hypothetical protein
MTTKSINLEQSMAELAKGGEIVPKVVKYSNNPQGNITIQPEDPAHLTPKEKQVEKLFKDLGDKGKNVDDLVVFGGPEAERVDHPLIEAPADLKTISDADYIAKLRVKHHLSEQQENTIKSLLRNGLLKKRPDLE